MRTSEDIRVFGPGISTVPVRRRRAERGEQIAGEAIATAREAGEPKAMSKAQSKQQDNQMV